MTTEAQIAANRENAKKSTGPSTPEGKAAVRLNGLKHGLTGETVVMHGEDPARFEALLDDYIAEYQPSTPTDEFLVRQLVMADWRLARLHRMEAAYHNLMHKQKMAYTRLEYPVFTADERLAHNATYHYNSKEGPESTQFNFHRYEMRLERSIRVAREALDRRRLASVSPAPVAKPKSQPSPKIINIETAERPQAPASPSPEPPTATETEVPAAPA